MEKLTVTQIATAIANITGEPVNPKSFNYKDRALERLAAAMAEQKLSIRAVLTAAGIEAITPDGAALSGLGLQADPPAPAAEQVEPPVARPARPAPTASRRS